MSYLGARVLQVNKGNMRTCFDVRPELTQNHGFVHAGALTSVMDATGGFAALTLLEPHQSILTAYLAVDLLRPASGDLVVVRAQIIKSGRTLIVGRATAVAVDKDFEDPALADLSKLAPCAVMTATFAVIAPRPTMEPQDVGAQSA
jgi:uncharacterized protein (TIGR00369 family)